ncbi:hypothetical protein DL96DRAFT_1763937 [Flagelloscypha sp. PMI_526]|nr:hypothetical protein DL96DRAFT_1763937 [Flagelloscypha sp. PMI_526]
MSSHFTWNLPELNKPEFVALTSLLSLKNGGQLDPLDQVSLEMEAEELDEADDDDEEGSISSTLSGDTTSPQRISQSSGSQLKKRFLDRLAEVLAHEPGALYVSCAVMQEYEDHVVVRVACNQGFKKSDRKFLRSFETIVSEISSTEENTGLDSDASEKLWLLLVEHYKPRLEWYVDPANSDIVKILDQLDPSLSLESPQSCLVDLRDAISQSRLGEASRIALVICSSSEVITQFKGHGASDKQDPPAPLSFSKITALLPKPLNGQSVQGFQKLCVHAEVQVFRHLAQARVDPKDLFPYVGCSKLSCFMCKLFLDSYCVFDMRGCHGKLYNQWTVPDINNISAEVVEKFRLTVIKLRQALLHELSKPLTRLDLVPESTARTTVTTLSETSHLSRGPASARFHFLNDLEYSRKRDAEVAYLRDELSTFTELPSSLSDSASLVLTKLLGAVRGVQPTSSALQAVNKSFHQRFSNIERGKCGIKVTTAEKLVVACIKDTLPPDSDVCTDHRFDRFPTLWEKRCLLGLYTGLTHKLLLGIRPAQLDHWLRNGVLSKEIVQAFETLPEQNRGGYYPWFKENLGTFDSLEAEGPDLSVIFERARACLDANDRHVKVGDLVPEAKQEAFVFYALIASGFSPEPSMEEWFDFGFDSLERSLPESAEKIFPRRPPCCTFTEFWKAFEEGSLIDLFKKHGFSEQLSKLPSHLSDFLSAPAWNMEHFSSGGGPVVPSVWALKHYIAVGNPWDDKFLPMPLQLDYGFRNCRGASPQKEELFHIYASVLARADPLELHQACIQGRLFDFCSQYTQIDQSKKKIMQNPYPLARDSQGLWKWSGMSSRDFEQFGGNSERQAQMVRGVGGTVHAVQDGDAIFHKLGPRELKSLREGRMTGSPPPKD